MPIARIDYQMTNNQLIFGRYLGTKVTIPAPWEGPGDNILKTSTPVASTSSTAVVLGHTQVVSASVVNAVRFTYNSTDFSAAKTPGFSAPPMSA